MTRFSSAAVLAVSVACAGCSPAARPGDAGAEILRLDADWSRLSSEGRDVDRIVSFWSEDAVVMPPGSAPVVGRAAIREFVTKSLQTPGFHISWKTNDVVVAKSGDIAYASGTNRITVNGADGKPAVIDGKSVTVWHKDPSGSWKCAVDIWNESPAPAP